MTMVFCRGCGKEIHDSATSCPHCGAPQANNTISSKVNWMPLVAIIVGSLGFLASFDFDPRDNDQIVGIVYLTTLSIILAAITLHQKKTGRTLAIIAITLALLGLLICLGNIP